MKNMKSLIVTVLVIIATSACSKGGDASGEAFDPNDFISSAAQKMRNVDNCTRDAECARAIAPIQSRRIN